MAASAPTQEMPPPGGYGPISYKRIPAKSYFRGWHWIAGLIVVKCVALYELYKNSQRIKYESIENRSARLAIIPLISAEMDRGMLRTIRLNRDEEEALMADVPGWEVGKLYSEPVFKTLNPDGFIEPSSIDYFIHAPKEEMYDTVKFRMWH